MITSVQNQRVKLWNKLKQRKFREETKMFLIEGYHTVEEALKSDWVIDELIIQENTHVPDWASLNNQTIVSEHVFHHITNTRNPQGIAAVVQMKQVFELEGKAILLIDEIQDPGNVGTIIRTADAAGYDGIVLGDGTVDLYNDKVVRATQGSLFHIPIIQANLQEKIAEMKQSGFTIVASSLKESTKYTELSVSRPFALIVGNEGSGVQEDLLQLSDEFIKIPIYGKAESLNVSVAAGILMYTLMK